MNVESDCELVYFLSEQTSKRLLNLDYTKVRRNLGGFSNE